MKSIDLKNAVEDPKVSNFTCMLFRLILGADYENKSKLARAYPVEVDMVCIFKTDGLCPYKKDNRVSPREVDYEEIERIASARNAGAKVERTWMET